MNNSVYVHYVTYNSSQYIQKSIESFLNQKGFLIGKNLYLSVTDNNSSDNTAEILQDLLEQNKVTKLNLLKQNTGFAAGHNLGASQFLKSDAKIFFIVNPDFILAEDVLEYFTLREHFNLNPKIAGIGGKILKADINLKPIIPQEFDSTGIVFTTSFRHLDRGAGEIDHGQYDKDEVVEGITGAALLLDRDFIEKASYRAKFDKDIFKIYSCLEQGYSERVQLFDEAFFAYREDADLALRARNIGYHFKYLAKTIGYHVRSVTPEKREFINPEINSMSVRNRFLLQINNFRFQYDWNKILSGVIIRNSLVVLGVLLKERTSLKGLKELLQLMRRAIFRRSFSSVYTPISKNRHLGL